MATIGKNTATGTSASASGNYVWASGPFTMPENGSAVDINIYSEGNLSSAKFLFGIYADNGSDYPGDLVGQTTEQTITFTGPGWVPAVPISANLSSGQKYWLMWTNDSGLGLYYDSGNLTKFGSRTYDSTLPDPFPAGQSSVARTYSIYINYTPGATDSITINSPEQYRPYQRNGSDQADIAIYGAYAGSPTSIEARFNSGAWSVIDSSPSAGTFSGTLANQAAGQGTVEVRFSNDTGVTDSVADISIGDIYIIAGQSNHSGRLVNNQSYSHASLKAVMWRGYGTTPTPDTWVELADPTGDNDSYGSIWPLLATLHMAGTGLPVAFITTAVGSTGLLKPTGWSNGGAQFEASWADVVASGVNDVRAMLWHQGENESNDGTVTQSQYQTALMQMLDDYQTDSGLASLKMGVGQLLRYTTAASRQSHDDIRAAQAYTWDNDADIFPGPVLCDLVGDGTHVVSDAEALIFAQRWWHFLNFQFFGGTEGRGPQFLSATKQSDTVIRVNMTVANAPLQGQTDTTGWRVEDDAGVLTVNSCAAYGTTGVDITVNRALSTNPVVSFGSLNDASGSTLTDTSAYDLPPEPFFNQTISAITYGVSGTVQESGSPVQRTVRAHKRSDGALAGSDTSAADGSFAISNLENGVEYYVVALDDDAGSDYNALIFDRVIPVEE